MYSISKRVTGTASILVIARTRNSRYSIATASAMTSSSANEGPAASRSRSSRHVPFTEVTKAPRDPMFELKKRYDDDSSSKKVDLGAGVYRNEDGQYSEFTSICKAKEVLAGQDANHDLASVQTVAGTGANRIGAALLSKYWPRSRLSNSSPNRQPVYVGAPTWGNYEPLFYHANFSDFRTFPHIAAESGSISVLSALRALESAPDQSIFIFQGCCHNPTGRSYTREQWLQILDVLLRKAHFAFFDVAYQGLGHPQLDGGASDVWAVREFARSGAPMLVCQSFSKNMGLYSERVGALHVVCESPAIAETVQDQLRSLIRWEVSSAPAYGARLVDIIMNDPCLRSEWERNLYHACKRIVDLRKRFHEALTCDGNASGLPSGYWDHILEEQGLFSFTRLTPSQVESLISSFGIYLPENGRINITGLNAHNIDQVAAAFNGVVRTTKTN